MLAGRRNCAAGAGYTGDPWADIATGALRPAAGWIGILAAVVAIIGLVGQSVLPPESSTIFVVYMAAGILFLIWFAWVGRELRRA